MKILSTLLIPCLAISANAADFDAKGRVLKNDDLKNPGIATFEKTKTVEQNAAKKPSVLKKTYSNDRVRAITAIYNSDDNTYYVDGKKKTESTYLNTYVASLEQQDAPRNNYAPINYTNTGAAYPNRTGNTCEAVNVNISVFKNNSNFSVDEYGFYNSGAGYSTLEYTGLFNDILQYSCQNIDPSNKYYNSCGQNIKIYNIVGDNIVNFNGNSCKDSRTKNYKEGIKHFYAKEVMKKFSQKASISAFKDRNGSKFAQHPSNPYNRNYHIGNVIATSLKDQTTYNAEAAALDDYIYYNRVIEFAPYTENGKKTGAGVSLNAISVEGINQWKKNNAYNAKTYDNVSSIDHPRFVAGTPSSHYRKPEIFYVTNSLSNAVTNSTTTTKLIKHDGSTYEFPGVVDSWGASTIASALTADLLSKRPFYKWHPEVVKALWLTAHSSDPTSQILNRSNNQVWGDYYFGEMSNLLFNNTSRYWYGNNEDFFTNETIDFMENVVPGQRYSWAIAWLVRGDYAFNEKHLSSNYTLEIYNRKTGALLKSSNDRLATHRVIHYTIPQGVTQITTKIKRIRNTGDRVIIGYNRHKVPSSDYVIRNQ